MVEWSSSAQFASAAHLAPAAALRHNARSMPAPGHELDIASPWVRRWSHLIARDATVLDVACGQGRHARYLHDLGLRVVAVDRDDSALRALQGLQGVTTCVADIEACPWPFARAGFGAVVVVNYLHRPLFPSLIDALQQDGVLIYETFAEGNEHYGRPANPDFLLRRNELLERFGSLQVVAFEQGLISAPKRAVIQRICAIRGTAAPAPLQPAEI